MSEWTKFRDNMLETIKVEEVTEDMKQSFITWLKDVALPVAKESAGNFIEGIREQSKAETGWSRARDFFVLPFIINVSLWIVESSLTKK